MNFPSELKYTEEHEWIRLEEDGTATIGITDFAQDSLGDIVYIDVDATGDTLEANAIFGSIEAVKTVSDLFLPVAGEILAFNEALDNEPELVNNSPYEQGWIIKVKPENPEALADLMDAEAYKGLINN